jgi:tetratricopeptide (TPR) repeat protein
VLTPSEALKRTYSGISEDDHLEVYLGHELLYSSVENYIIDRPHQAPTDALDDLYILAREHENRRSYGKAMEAYLELIEMQPLHLEAAERLAELYARRGEYDRALRYARKVLEIDAYLPGGNFVYGHIQNAMGNFTDARDGFRWAARSLEYRSASLQLLSEINLREEKPELAYDQAGQSLSFNDMNLNSYKVRAIAQRIMNHPAGAEEVLDRLLEIDPLNHFAMFEKYLLEPSSDRLNDFNTSFKSEMTKDEYLEIALYYSSLGMKAEAVKVLEQAPYYPVNNYWLAWLHREDQEASRSYLEKAISASPEYVFPYRTETLSVLEWASEQNPAWITDYYAALILWNVERNEEALGLLMKWGETPDFTPFYHSRAYLQGIISDGALEDMERALALDPGHWRIYRELANMHIKRGEYSSALTIVETGHKKFPESYILDLIYSKCLNLTGKYQESLDVLDKTNVLPFEGEQSGHLIFTNNHLMLAFDYYKGGNYETALSHIDQSEAYPENLGSGMPYFPDYRNQNILRKMIYDRTGKILKSREASEAIQAYDQKFGKRKDGSIFD